ncbi:MAG: DNA replication/repair protein RecF [Chloroflexi bacterium]|nr:DNA replication/repair protein RecF [Chloroflexota bacterium]
MYVVRLELTGVRTFRRLELPLTRGVHLILGANASGKTNLVESIAMLATTRGMRAGSDIDLIAWDSLAEDPLPAARLVAEVETAGGRTTLEIAVIAGERPADGVPTRATRRFRVNGVARRASDLIGRLRVVMFSAEDLRIVEGPPALRRRYLDITLAQLDPAYVRASQRYARVLQQRNSLLRRLQERRGAAGELEFWDDELAAAGAVLLASRADALRRLGRDAAVRYDELGPAGERLSICYRPAVPDEMVAALAEHDLAERFRAALEAGRRGDIDRGMTRIGPHRDDVAFAIGGRDAAAFASRGQQRTIALALRLAEVTLSTERTGDPPVLLLDDILSELDAHRRERVLSAAYGVDQVVITTPDDDRPGAEELPGATRYRMAGGTLARI